MKQPYISIVIPVYKAEKVIDRLVDKLIESVEKVTSDYEIVLEEDHSPDQS